MIRSPGKHYQPWTDEQIGDLRRLAAEGRPVREIAKTLGRTEEAVSARARAEKVALSSERRKPRRPSPTRPNDLWRPSE